MGPCIHGIPFIHGSACISASIRFKGFCPWISPNSRLDFLLEVFKLLFMFWRRNLNPFPDFRIWQSVRLEYLDRPKTDYKGENLETRTYFEDSLEGFLSPVNTKRWAKKGGGGGEGGGKGKVANPLTQKSWQIEGEWSKMVRPLSAKRRRSRNAFLQPQDRPQVINGRARCGVIWCGMNILGYGIGNCHFSGFFSLFPQVFLSVGIMAGRCLWLLVSIVELTYYLEEILGNLRHLEYQIDSLWTVSKTVPPAAA